MFFQVLLSMVQHAIRQVYAMVGNTAFHARVYALLRAPPRAFEIGDAIRLAAVVLDSAVRVLSRRVADVWQAARTVPTNR